MSSKVYEVLLRSLEEEILQGLSQFEVPNESFIMIKNYDKENQFRKILFAK